jgi:ABC-type branched-subunit amino acid transport system substrate-binding protein
MRVRYLFLLGVLLSGCATYPKAEPIWVGHLAPLSGPERDRGEQALVAMNQALAQAREDDFSIAGRPLGVRHVDSAKGTARAEAVRLLSVNRVCALVAGPGVEKPDDLLAAARLYATPVVVLDELPELPAKSSGVVLLAADPARRGEALAEVARKELKRSRAAVVVAEGLPVQAALTEAFSRTWRERKGDLRRWTTAELRQHGQVEELRRWKPDVVLLAVGPGRPKEMDEALTVLAAQALILDGGEDRDGPPLAWLDRGAKDGPAICTASAFSRQAHPTDEGRKLLDQVRKKQDRPAGLAAVLALDAIGLLRLRPDVLRDLDREYDLAKRLTLLDDLAPPESFDSVMGPMHWKDGRPVRPLFVVQYQGGKEKLLRTIEAKR